MTDPIEKGRRAEAALKLLREQFVDREHQLVTQMVAEFKGATLTPERAFAYAGQFRELREFVSKLERERDQGIRALNSEVNQ